MRSLKTMLPTLILILLVYGWYFFINRPHQQQITHVLGANTNITLYEEPDTGRQPILDAINAAKKEILVEVYLLSDKQIITALDNEKADGVDVRVMMEKHPVGSESLNQKTKQILDAHGVETAWSNPTFSLTHEKAIVIDDSEAFILSQNLTTSAFTKNREYDVLDLNPTDVTEIRNIFIDDWNRTAFSPPVGNVIESPDNSRSALTTLISDADTSIDAETEDIDDPQIISLLSEKAKTMPVKLLVPTLKQLSSNQLALEQLTAAGVRVKTISSPYMHAKLILTDEKKAYTGSINFSKQSLDQNRELGIILTQPDSLQTLETTFQNDWNNGSSFSN